MIGRRIVILLLAGAIGACGGPSPTSTNRPESAGVSPSPSAAATRVGPPSPSPSTATHVSVQLRGTIRAEFAGFIAAIDEGYYDAADLDVTLVDTPPGQDPIAAGSATDGPDFTVAWVPAVLQARGAGTSDLVDIGQLFQRSGTLSISRRDDDIISASGFKDKTVGVFGFGEGIEVLAAAAKAGLKEGTDFETSTQDADLDGVLPRRYDVAQTTIYDGYARILESENPSTHARYSTTDLNVISWYDEGTATLQDAIFSRASWLAGEGNDAIAERFLKATFQGWIYCRDHASDCVTATIAAGERAVVSSGSAGASPIPGIASQRPAASAAGSGVPPAGASSSAAPPAASGSPGPPAPRLTFGPGHTAWSMNEVNALVWPAPLGIGVVDPTLWAHAVDVCLAAGAIPAAPPDDAMRTDLAKSALAELSDIDTSGLSFAKSPIEITPDGQ